MFDREELAVLLKALSYYKINGCGFQSHDYKIACRAHEKISGKYFNQHLEQER